MRKLQRLIEILKFHYLVIKQHPFIVQLPSDTIQFLAILKTWLGNQVGVSVDLGYSFYRQNDLVKHNLLPNFYTGFIRGSYCLELSAFKESTREPING